MPCCVFAVPQSLHSDHHIRACLETIEAMLLTAHCSALTGRTLPKASFHATIAVPDSVSCHTRGPRICKANSYKSLCSLQLLGQCSATVKTGFGLVHLDFFSWSTV